MAGAGKRKRAVETAKSERIEELKKSIEDKETLAKGENLDIKDSDSESGDEDSDESSVYSELDREEAEEASDSEDDSQEESEESNDDQSESKNGMQCDHKRNVNRLVVWTLKTEDEKTP